MKEIAKSIKRMISAQDVASRYGIAVNRKGWACCPFHAEDTPSTRFFDDERGFHCYGCGAGSSVIDFVMMYFDISFKQAIVRINNDFSLGLDIRRPLSWAEKEQMRRRMATERSERAKLEEAARAARSAYDEEFACWISLERMKHFNRPKAQNEPFNDAFAFALHQLPISRDTLDYLEYQMNEMEARARSGWKEAM